MLAKSCFKVPDPFTCPACNGSVTTVRYVYNFEEKKSNILSCPDCGMMFARPVPISVITRRQMNGLDDAELFHNPFLKLLHRKFIVMPEIVRVKRLLKRDRFSLLDIGCGTGWTTNIWKEEGAEVTGLEPSLNRGKIASERFGFRVIPSYIEDLATDETFDVIIIRHVLEHFADPFQVLTHVRGHLKDGGLLVVIVPNIDCIGRYIFGTKWSWILPWHCNFFNPSSLARIAHRAGFTPCDLYQMPSPLWYPRSFLQLLPGGDKLRSRIYKRLSSLVFIPFAPVVAAGVLSGYSDNITLITRVSKEISVRD
jgi:2-polyprenyl-3-methyl-5-hydroxy-6-metoxy-1,4-benzoquinol methylase